MRLDTVKRRHVHEYIRVKSLTFIFFPVLSHHALKFHNLLSKFDHHVRQNLHLYPEPTYVSS